MGYCFSCCRRDKRDSEREPLLPQHAHPGEYVPKQTTLDKYAECLAALSAGKLPSQVQLNVALQALQRSSMLHYGDYGPLTARGVAIVESARELIEAFIQIGMEKNDDDLIQDFLYQNTLVDVPVVVAANVETHFKQGEANLTAPPISPEEIKADIRGALASLKTLSMLFLSSSAFRTIMNDVLELSRVIITNVAEDVVTLAATVQVNADRLRDGVAPFVDTQDIPDGAADGLKDTVGEAVDEVIGQSAKTWTTISEDTPQRLKDEALERIKSFILAAQARPSYKQAVSSLFFLMQKYTSAIASTTANVTRATEEATSSASVSITPQVAVQFDPHLKQALLDLKFLVERFASGRSVDILAQCFTRLCMDVVSDEQGLSLYFSALYKWFLRALNEPSWVQTRAAGREAERLYDAGQDLIKANPRWKADAQAMLAQLDGIVIGFKSDKATQRVIHAFDRIIGNVSGAAAATAGVVAQKQQAIRNELWKNAVGWLLPRVLPSLLAIPLPRFELKSDAIDLAVHGLVLQSPSFIPDHVRITQTSDIQFTASAAARQDGNNLALESSSLRVSIDGLRISVHDIGYYVHFRSGWFSWLDSGLMSVNVGGRNVAGDGLKVAIELQTDLEESEGEDGHVFRVANIDADIPGLQFGITQSRHWMINAVVQPFIAPAVRQGAGLVIRTQLREALEKLDAFLTRVRHSAIAENSDPSISTYWDALMDEATRPIEVRSESEQQDGTDDIEEPPQEPETETELHTSLKGVVRTTRIIPVDGTSPVQETSIAIGIGPQLLPEVERLGPHGNDPSKVMEEEARRELDEAAKQLKQGVEEMEVEVEEAIKAARTVEREIGHAAEQARVRKRREERRKGWRSDAFSLP